MVLYHSIGFSQFLLFVSLCLTPILPWFCHSTSHAHSLILYFWVSAFACLSVLCLPLNCIHLSLQHRQWSFVWYAGVLSMGGAAKGAPAEVNAAD